MDMLVSTVATVVNLTAFMHMLLYMRGTASFKRCVSLLAWLLMIATVFNLFRLWTPVGQTLPITAMEVVWQALLCAPIILQRGNVSFLLPRGRKHEDIR